MARIDTVTTHRLSVPLSVPYRLSHHTLEALEVVIVAVRLADGTVGYGEATPLCGYSSESDDEVWDTVTSSARDIAGRSVTDGLSILESTLSENPFSRTALTCAVETAVDAFDTPLSAPIVGILSTNDDLEMTRQRLEEQIARGYRNIKVKIGFDAASDAARLECIVDSAPPNVQFRVDANQGYDHTNARRFLSRAPLERLQVVEQPLPVGHLHEHAALQADYPIKVMLDEEISSIADLDAAYEADAAGAVKFKLMKHGSLLHTGELIERARELGFEVVIGNGVQSDIGCLLESHLWSRYDLSMAGEFNGWLKQQQPLLASPPMLDKGNLSWRGKTLDLATDSLDAYRIDRRQFRS